MRGSLLLLKVIAVFLVLDAAYALVSRKSLAGPPSEFGLYNIPAPTQSAATTTAALLPVRFTQSLSDGHSGDITIDVDSSSYFAFTVYCPASTTVTLYDANRKVVDISGLGTSEKTEILGTSVPTTTYEIKKPVPGVYTLHIATPTKLDRVSETEPDAYVVIMNESPLEMQSYVNTYNLVVGSQIGLVAQAVSGNQLVGSNSKLGSVQSAKLDIIFPDGSEKIIDMKDDGLDGDLIANDGAFLAAVPSTESGLYTLQASITGLDASGHAFMRTAEHVFSVSSIATAFTGKGAIQPANAQKMVPIQIGLSKTVSTSVRVYGELFGTSSGKQQALCWVGGIVDVQSTNGVPTATLLVDVDWFGTKVGSGPYTLKNVVMQDVDSWSVVATISTVQLVIVNADLMRSYEAQRVHVITERMRQGPRPEKYALNRNDSTASPIVLLHGYCSLYNPFEPAAADFTNPKFFLNSKASLGHDAYAKLLADWSSEFGSYSAIGHSQGGIVATHLKNYYWSGMDQVKGTGRQVQSVASPYQGNSAAGVIARLGKLFGIGCGTNADLTVAGSTLWLSGISADTRSLVHFYTATYKTTAFFDYCNLAMNLVLKGYNDGVAESKFTPLLGGNNEGNDEPWCHSDNMKYPPIYLDHARNQLMNALAQRSSGIISTISHTSTTSAASKAGTYLFGLLVCLLLSAL